MAVSKTAHLGSNPSTRASLAKYLMSKDIISEGPAMRKFMNIVTRPEFGKKPAETEDQAADRRTKEVTDRAKAEKKSFGFLRSVANKTFGKKGEPVKQERSEDERRQAVVDRAKVNEGYDGSEDYWYDNRHLLRPGMIFKTRYGDIVELDRRVPGDGTRWYVADWWNGSFAYMDSEIEPGDLEGDPLPEDWNK